MTPESTHADSFYHDGRGPALVRVHYDTITGSGIVAADFLNPDDTRDRLKHLLFVRAQAFQFTPEEEYTNEWVDWARTGNAAIIDLGRSAWYRSFTNRHSSDCRHFHIMFYDEVLDIICHAVELKAGGYLQDAL